MKRLIFFLMAALVLFSCSNEIPEQEVPSYRGRTILAYLVSNNTRGTNLDRYLKQNVQWMYQRMSTMKDSCRLLIFYRPEEGDALLSGPSILEFLSDGQGNINGQPAVSEASVSDVFHAAKVLKSYTVTEGYNATDPAVMEQVFRDIQIAAPSDHYGLIFGSHATGWMPADKTVGRAFGEDNGYSINIPELHDVLVSSFGMGKLDFILFDACMMGAVEVAYELRDVTDYIIASVMETSTYGFPYYLMFDCLLASEINYQQICNIFTNYYNNHPDYGRMWGTCAAIDCSGLDELSRCVSNELAAYADSLATMDFRDVQQYGAGSYRNFSFDVKDFFSVLEKGTVSAGLQAALERTVVAKSCIPGKYSSFPLIEESRFCGIGMYVPGQTMDQTWDEYYQNSISWYSAVGWNRFVVAY